MQNFRYFNPKSPFWSLPQIPDPKPAATPVMGKKIPFIIFSCSQPCGSYQAWRGGEKQEQGWVRGPKKSALHPKTEELPAEALHKCFIGRREMDTKRDSDREATDRDTFSFRGGTDSDDKRAPGSYTRLEILPRGQHSPSRARSKIPKGYPKDLGCFGDAGGIHTPAKRQ